MSTCSIGLGHPHNQVNDFIWVLSAGNFDTQQKNQEVKASKQSSALHKLGKGNYIKLY